MCRDWKLCVVFIQGRIGGVGSSSRRALESCKYEEHLRTNYFSVAAGVIRDRKERREGEEKELTLFCLFRRFGEASGFYLATVTRGFVALDIFYRPH